MSDNNDSKEKLNFTELYLSLLYASISCFLCSFPIINILKNSNKLFK